MRRASPHDHFDPRPQRHRRSPMNSSTPAIKTSRTRGCCTSTSATRWSMPARSSATTPAASSRPTANCPKNISAPASISSSSPIPLEAHRGPDSAVAYLYPQINQRPGHRRPRQRKLGLGLAIRYNTNEFPRCGNWQHWGPHEYVTALEPMNGGVEGRDKDRANGWLDTLAAGARKSYRYEIEVMTERSGLDGLLALNG